VTTGAQAGEYVYVGGGKKVVRCGPRGKRCVVRRHAPRGGYVVDDGAGVAAAILGLAGVAIVAGALSETARPIPAYPHAVEPLPAPGYRYQGPAQTYYPPAPAPRDDDVVSYAGTLEPWTAGWYDWCDKRYKSFNPDTGTYRGYDGRDHFCVPK